MYHLQVITPEKIVYDDKVTSLIAPATDGYLGVLTDHAPLITTLKEGVFIITREGKEKYFYKITGGFLEVNNNEVSVLVETLEETMPVDMGGGI